VSAIAGRAVFDVAVVGAGPAGVAASLAAADAGATVVLIDEQPAVGGALRWRVAVIPDLEGSWSDLRGFQLAERLSAAIADRGVERRMGTVAWGLFPEPSGFSIALTEGEEGGTVRARRVVVATGSTDRMDPFRGATLPGVITGRAMLIALHLHRVLPGRTVAVLGAGLYATEVVEAISLAGGTVVVRPPGAAGVRVTGRGAVERIEGQHETWGHNVDVVAVAVGRQADPALAFQTGAAAGFVERLGGTIPRRGERLETSLAGVFVAGCAGGICPVAESLAEGRLAGLAAAEAGENAVTLARGALDRLRPANRAALYGNAEARLVEPSVEPPDSGAEVEEGASDGVG
jgi:sarcosine oxidase subunit alpha